MMTEFSFLGNCEEVIILSLSNVSILSLYLALQFLRKLKSYNHFFKYIFFIKYSTLLRWILVYGSISK